MGSNEVGRQGLREKEKREEGGRGGERRRAERTEVAEKVPSLASKRT